MGVGGGSAPDPFQGVIFYAPLTQDFSAEGGTLTNQNSWTINSNYQGKACADGPDNRYSGYGLYWDMDNPITGHVPFTFSCQYYYNPSSTNNQGLFYIGQATNDKIFGYEKAENTAWATAWGTATYDNALTVVQDAWTRFTAVYDGELIKLYNDTTLLATSSSVTLDIQKSTGGFLGNYGDLCIGGRGGDKRPWFGGIRQFYIFNKALNADEVTALYNATKDL